MERLATCRIALSNSGMLIAKGEGPNIEIFQRKHLSSGPAVSLNGHKSTVKLLLFVSGWKLAAARQDGSIEVWHHLKQEKLWSNKFHQAPVTSLAVSLDGELLASADSFGVIAVWDSQTGKLVREINWQSCTAAFLGENHVLSGFSYNYGSKTATRNWDL